MSWTPPSTQECLDILRNAKTVAILGASDNPARASHTVGSYLLSSSDFTVWFVNPRAETVLGHKAYASLADLPGQPDVVDVFRNPADLPEVVDEAITAGAKTLWLQLGIFDEDIANQAEAAGMNVVMDRCVKIEHTRLHGD